jgi:hypothetical protein
MRHLTTMVAAGIVAVLVMCAFATAAFADNPEISAGCQRHNVLR